MLDAVGDISEYLSEKQFPYGVNQKVLKNGQLVKEIFDYKRSHFSVSENEGIFR
jgi:hypothetical protein